MQLAAANSLQLTSAEPVPFACYDRRLNQAAQLLHWSSCHDSRTGFREGTSVGDQNLDARTKGFVGDRDPGGQPLSLPLWAIDDAIKGGGLGLPVMVSRVRGLFDRNSRGGWSALPLAGPLGGICGCCSVQGAVRAACRLSRSPWGLDNRLPNAHHGGWQARPRGLLPPE